MRSNGLPPLRDLPIKFKRRDATPGFEKLVGKETDRAKHAPYEYASEDGRWLIRSVQHTGYGSTLSGRVRWYVICDGRLFTVGFGSSGCYTLSREDAIDEIHRKIARGLREGFEVLAQIRRDAEAALRTADKRAADLVKARELLGQLYGADPTRMVEALAEHVDLDRLVRAVDQASRLVEEI